MEIYLPFIKATLSEWYLLTLNNPLYAGVLTLAVWLLTAILYSIRLAAIKKDKAASEKASSNSLNALQEQLQHNQKELTEATSQMEKATTAKQDETQRALALEQLIYQRNKKIAETIQTLALSFDFSERPLLVSEDLNADLLWQQHDKVISRLIERLHTEQETKIELQKTCQAETAKLAEKEAMFAILQTTLAAHTNQLSNLEQALEEQKAILQQQDNTQLVLSADLKKYQANATHPAQPEQTVNASPQPMQLEISPSTGDTLIAQAVPDNQPIQIEEEPQMVAQPELIMPDPIAAMPTSINPQQESEEVLSESPSLEQEPVTPAKGSLGKIKNLFGKTKQQPVKTEPRWTLTKPNKKEVLLSNAVQQPDDETADKTKNTQGKLKDFYSKFTSKAK